MNCTQMISFTSTQTTVCWEFVVVFGSIAIDWKNLKCLMCMWELWESIVYPVNMGAICHNDIGLMGTAVRYLKSHLNISMQNVLAHYSVSRVSCLTHITFVLLHDPIVLSPISSNVRSLHNLNTSSSPMLPLSSWQHSNTFPHWSHHCCIHSCLRPCCTLHTSTAWSVQYNVPHITVSASLLIIPAIDVAASLHYILQTTTIVETAAVMV